MLRRGSHFTVAAAAAEFRLENDLLEQSGDQINPMNLLLKKNVSVREREWPP